MASTLRNICLIDCTPRIAQAMQLAGHTILQLNAAPKPFFDLEAALCEHDFTPELVIHTERLTSRTVVTGLDSVDCPTVLWCVDPHLNAHWHSAYARLFDLVCSTQRAWIPAIRQQGAKDVRWLPWFGYEQPWTPWSERDHHLTFVGRVSKQRPARKWMMDLIRQRAASHEPTITEGLYLQQMLDLYRQSRIIPNEAIFGEINFRLFEAASCGCLVLDQDLGEEQRELFEPGREFDTYTYATDFCDKLDLYLSNDRLAQAMGRAAYERIQAQHLAVHRMQRLLDYADDATRNRAVGTDADKWEALAACAMWEAGVIDISAKTLLPLLAQLPQDDDVATATLRMQTTTHQTTILAGNLKAILTGDLYPDSPALNLAGSMASLHTDHWDGAKAFWYRYIKHAGLGDKRPPATPAELLTLWAKQLKDQGRLVRAGFSYDPSKNLASTAAECLINILQDKPEDLPTLRLLDTVLKPVTGLEQARVGYLSILTLHERDDWRLALEIALSNLKSYRLASGLEELQVARNIAANQGQTQAFDRVLKGSDPSGSLAHQLAGR